MVKHPPNMLVDLFDRAVRHGLPNLEAVPDLIKRIIREDAWREWPEVPSTGEGHLLHFEMFAEFLKHLEINPRTLQHVCRDDLEALSLLDEELRKKPGELDWCWQTVSTLQSMWKSLDLDFERYQRVFREAEEHRIWERIPPDNPYGSKEVMLEALKVGDESAARARVANGAVTARPLSPYGTNQHHKGVDAGQLLYSKGGNGSAYLTARIARDRPDILARMKNGEFPSVAAAAREAGVQAKRHKTMELSGDINVVAAALKRHYTLSQLQLLITALRQSSPEHPEPFDSSTGYSEVGSEAPPSMVEGRSRGEQGAQGRLLE